MERNRGDHDRADQQIFCLKVLHAAATSCGKRAFVGMQLDDHQIRWQQLPRFDGIFSFLL